MMSSAKSLSEMTVCVVGLGLMGGSLAKGLKGHCARVLGVDIEMKSLLQAQADGVIDEGGLYLTALASKVDLLIFAVPVQTITALIPLLPEVFSGEMMVMDLGSTKKTVMDAYEELPKRFDVLGVHPMCGKAKGGYDQAEAALFKDATFALVHASRTSERAARIGLELVSILGAVPIWMTADEHDRAAADISHLPYLVSCVLTAATPEEAALLIGSGFRSTSRLAATPLSMMGDILITNRENILESMDRFNAVFQKLKTSLEAEDFSELFEALQKIQMSRENLLSRQEMGDKDEA
jgi:prephenate dehydrogenase